TLSPAHAVHPRDLHSFPTRRSSDLGPGPHDSTETGTARLARLESSGATRLPSGLAPPSGRSPPGRVRIISPPGSCGAFSTATDRSEEHTSELQSRGHLVCRLLLEKK